MCPACSYASLSSVRCTGVHAALLSSTSLNGQFRMTSHCLCRINNEGELGQSKSSSHSIRLPPLPLPGAPHLAPDSAISACELQGPTFKYAGSGLSAFRAAKQPSALRLFQGSHHQELLVLIYAQAPPWSMIEWQAWEWPQQRNVITRGCRP